MIQYKLLEVLDKSTLEKLFDIFGKSNVLVFNFKLVGIKYDYEYNTYSDVLRKVAGLNLRQLIITSIKFTKIIEFSIENNLCISKINFLEFIDEEIENKIKNYLIALNRKKNKSIDDKDSKNLFDSLKFITSEECIDIKSLSIDLTNSEKVEEFTFFNNGVIITNNSNFILNKIINKMYKEV